MGILIEVARWARREVAFAAHDTLRRRSRAGRTDRYDLNISAIKNLDNPLMLDLLVMNRRLIATLKHHAMNADLIAALGEALESQDEIRRLNAALILHANGLDVKATDSDRDGGRFDPWQFQVPADERLRDRLAGVEIIRKGLYRCLSAADGRLRAEAALAILLIYRPVNPSDIGPLISSASGPAPSVTWIEPRLPGREVGRNNRRLSEDCAVQPG